MLTTQLTTDYQLDLPVVSAGMAFVARPDLAAAVSAAGGLGVLGATAMPPELLAAEIAAIRSATDRPFGVNLIPRFGAEEQVALCATREVPVVVFFWDKPEAQWIEQLKAAETKVWIQVGSLAEADEAVKLGADVVVVQGAEAGGHNRSSASTMTLVPAVAQAIAPVPVVAAGGIADGRGVVAAVALGAQGAWLGTRFLASTEADAHQTYKARVVEATVEDTARHSIFGFDFPGASVRGLRNQIVAEYEGRDTPWPYEGLDPESLPQIGTASVFGQEVPMAKFTGLPPTAAATGDLEQMSLLAGESTGLIADELPAAEIVQQLADEIETTIDRCLKEDTRT